MEDPCSEKASEKAAAKATASSSSTTAIADKTVRKIQQVMDQVRVCPLCQVTRMPKQKEELWTVAKEKGELQAFSLLCSWTRSTRSEKS